ncbi:unnamed protein product [Rhodiola kirilowii]
MGSFIAEQKPALSEIKEKAMTLLNAKEDIFGGVVMEVDEEDIEPAVFASLLKTAMDRFNQQEKNGIWLKLDLKVSSLVDPAVKQGFRYHHAEPDYLMLICWLPSRPCTLPANASHRVGVGAFVMNDEKEVII